MQIDVFNSFSYVQTGNYCVLASYSAALWPWLRVTPLTFFSAYCQEFGLSPDARCAEPQYLADFIPRYSQPGMSGYRVLAELHAHGTHPLFKRARLAASHEFVSSVDSEASRIEAALRSATDSVLMAFINRSSFAGLVASHSITIFADSALHHFDSNVGVAIPSASALTGLGALGEGILFTGVSALARTA